MNRLQLARKALSDVLKAKKNKNLAPEVQEMLPSLEKSARQSLAAERALARREMAEKDRACAGPGPR